MKSNQITAIQEVLETDFELNQVEERDNLSWLLISSSFILLVG